MVSPMRGAGFEEWVAARLGSLTRFAYLVTGSQSEAEDSLQAALEKVCAKWSKVSVTDDPETYVRRMIANEHVSAWRRFRRRETPVEVVAADRDSGVGVEEADAIWRACAQLPRQQRAAVVLRFYEDREYAEIAAILDVTESTVRAHIHRGLAALRAALSEEDQ